MTNQEAKAEAEKIIHLYRDHVAIDYQYDEEPLRNCQIECAIIHVKGILKEIEFIHDRMIKSDLLAAAGAIYSRIEHWQSILTQLEKL